jgi:hypothetical protein
MRRSSQTDMVCTSSVLQIMILFVLYVWALIVAARVRDPNSRVLHLLAALLFGPLYLLAYYGSMVVGVGKTSK